MKYLLIAVLVHATTNSALRFRADSLEKKKTTNQKGDVAVCIVGQLSRLEYKTKMENLLKPMNKTGTKIDVFLSLQLGESQYSTPAKKLLHFESMPNVVETYFKDLFGDFYHSGSTRSFKDYEPWARDNNFEKHFPRYWPDGGAGGNQFQYISLHMNQWASWSDCMGLVKKAEQTRGAKYDTLLKMRENTIVINDQFDIHLENKRAVTGKECAGWGGLNDKAAMLPREYAENYMNGPVKFIKQILKQGGQTQFINTEGILQASLEQANVPIAKVSADALPMVDGRPSEGFGFQRQDTQSDEEEEIEFLARDTAFCLVPEEKDCYPKTWKQLGLNTCGMR